MNGNKLRDGITEISNAMTRIDGERDYIKETINRLADECHLDKRAIRKLARLWHLQTFDKEQSFQAEVESLYEVINKGNTSA